MKLKRSLLIILLAVIATMLLQLQVNATEIDYSEYDYLLTETGIVAKSNLTGTETVIAGIKGEYTGEITADIANRKVTINNFNADKLKVFELYNVWIEGENCVYETEFLINCYGDGTILTKGVVDATITGKVYPYR